MQQDHTTIIDDDNGKYVPTDTLLKIQEEQRDKLINQQITHRQSVEASINDLTQPSNDQDYIHQSYQNKIKLLKLESMHERQRLEQGYFMEMQKQQERHLFELQSLHMKFMKQMQEQQERYIDEHMSFKEYVREKNHGQSSVSTSSNARRYTSVQLDATHSPRFSYGGHDNEDQ